MQFGIERTTLPHNVKGTSDGHWVCFGCRKMFRKPRGIEASPCPQCAAQMVDMGRYFEPPRNSNIRLWNRIKQLAETGFRFSSASSRSFVFGKWSERRRPSLRTVSARMDGMIERRSKPKAQ